ncbi:hypothetical protein [uncultured Chryseobacterium sp.]|uniref:hypothetical protein n=1 Tax=uncultured Chryseobacterium sp. TaxID=259322 RepID=UPI0025E0ED72|nr:hypothetical protein [uncultured Chryseobacterium sp.]
MKKLLQLFTITLFNFLYSQVGINTPNPKSTLDINGDLTIREVQMLSSLNSNHSLIIRDKSTQGDDKIKEISSNYFSYESTAYYASKKGSWSLLDIGVGSSYSKVNLTGNLDTKFGNPQLFTNGVYTAPQNGLYGISYDIQLESGVNIEVLGGKKLAVLKNNNIWEEKLFDGVRISLLSITLSSVPVTSTTIQSIVPLNAGDTLTFAVDTTGLINLGILTDSKINIYVYKISN